MIVTLTTEEDKALYVDTNNMVAYFHAVELDKNTFANLNGQYIFCEETVEEFQALLDMETSELFVPFAHGEEWSGLVNKTNVSYAAEVSEDFTGLGGLSFEVQVSGSLNDTLTTLGWLPEE